MKVAASGRGLIAAATTSAALATGLVVGIFPPNVASAGNWANCPVDPSQTIMFAQVRNMTCPQARKVGKAAVEAWDGRSRTISVQGFTCRMRSGLPYNVSIGGTCKKGSLAVKFSTGD